MGSSKQACALLSVACAILKKWPGAGKHDDYVRFIVNALWHHKVEKADCEKIITAVIKILAVIDAMKTEK